MLPLLVLALLLFKVGRGERSEQRVAVDKLNREHVEYSWLQHAPDIWMRRGVHSSHLLSEYKVCQSTD